MTVQRRLYLIRFSGWMAVALQVLLAYPYVGVAALVVPRPLFFAFWALWLAGLAVAIGLAFRRPAAALLIPIAWGGLYVAAAWAGTTFLDWGP